MKSCGGGLLAYQALVAEKAMGIQLKAAWRSSGMVWRRKLAYRREIGVETSAKMKASLKRRKASKSGERRLAAGSRQLLAAGAAAEENTRENLWRKPGG